MGTNFLILIVVTVTLLTGVILDYHYSGGKVVDERRKRIKKKREKMAKERTLNEYRQTKDSVYKHPKKDELDEMKNSFDSQYIMDLVEEFPNDQELGREVRKYILFLKNFINV